MVLETVVVSDDNLYDCVIIGAGPAGLNLASLLANKKYKVCFIEPSAPGGKLSYIDTIRGYKKNNINGSQLAMELYNEAIKNKAKYICGKVTSIEKKLEYIGTYIDNGQIIYGKTTVIATGTEYNKLNVVGEGKYFQKGVSYCISCDGVLAKNQPSFIVGDGDEAIAGAIQLNEIFHSKPTIITRNSKLKSKLYSIAKLNSMGIEVILNSNINEIYGNNYLMEGFSYTSNQKIIKQKTNHLFIEIGHTPAISILKDMNISTTNGYIKVNKSLCTNNKQVFAIGDVIHEKTKSVKNAICDSEIVLKSIINYLTK